MTQALPAEPVGPVRHPPWLPIGIGALVAGLLLLALVGAVLVRGTAFGVDHAILLAMRRTDDPSRAVGPAWLPEAARDLTALGSVTVLTLVVVVALGALLVARRRLTALLVFGGTFGGAWAVTLAKRIVHRARPELIDHLTPASGLSFPSGHATSSAIIYLTLAALLMQVTPNRAVRRYIPAVAVILVLMIGATRVYLGVHWPSDVAAGWCFGTLWALAWWSLGAWLRLRRAAA